MFIELKQNLKLEDLAVVLLKVQSYDITPCRVVFLYQCAEGFTAANYWVIQEEGMSLMLQFRPDLPKHTAWKLEQI